MQWNSKENAGFSSRTAKPWLPLHPNYAETNVQVTRNDFKIDNEIFSIRNFL